MPRSSLQGIVQVGQEAIGFGPVPLARLRCLGVLASLSFQPPANRVGPLGLSLPKVVGLTELISLGGQAVVIGTILPGTGGVTPPRRVPKYRI